MLWPTLIIAMTAHALRPALAHTVQLAVMRWCVQTLNAVMRWCVQTLNAVMRWCVHTLNAVMRWCVETLNAVRIA
jgi:hypothetical protein